MSKKKSKIQPEAAVETAVAEVTTSEIAEALEQAAGKVEFTAEELLAMDTATNDTIGDGSKTVEESPELTASNDPKAPFQQLIGAITARERDAQNAGLIAAFEERARYEVEKNPSNDAIQKKLSAYIKPLQTPGVLSAQIVAGLPAGFVNTMENSNARRNVYAIQKLSDLLYGAVTGHVKNAINRAVLGSMVKLAGKAALPFTGLAAKACASDKIGIESAYKAELMRHTVSESTASTQASSTMTALEDLGVVKNVGTRVKPVYEFTATALAERLKEIGGLIALGKA